MAKYRVIAFKHVCKNNYIAKKGEVVDETQLTSNAADLVNAGFIELVDVESAKKGEVVDETKKEANDIKVNDAKEVKSDKKK